MALKRFHSLALPIFLCDSEVWNPYQGYYFSTWDKTEVERVHLQFLKRLLGVLRFPLEILWIELNWKIPIEADIETVNFIKYERDVQKRL